MKKVTEIKKLKNDRFINVYCVYKICEKAQKKIRGVKYGRNKRDFKKGCKGVKI